MTKIDTGTKELDEVVETLLSNITEKLNDAFEAIFIESKDMAKEEHDYTDDRVAEAQAIDDLEPMITKGENPKTWDKISQALVDDAVDEFFS